MVALNETVNVYMVFPDESIEEDHDDVIDGATAIGWLLEVDVVVWLLDTHVIFVKKYVRLASCSECGVNTQIGLLLMISTMCVGDWLKESLSAVCVYW